MLFSQQLKVTHVEQINHDTKKITLALPNSNEISGVASGGALLVDYKPASWFPALRPYTPISSPTDRGTLQLLVKKYPGGSASTYLHDLQPGQPLTVRGPLPGYKATPAIRDVILIAGGAGITPIYSIARAHLADPEDETRVQLIWGVNSTRDLVLETELDALQQAHPKRLRVTYCVSGADSLPPGGPCEYKAGYVDGSVIKQAYERNGPVQLSSTNATRVLICGPPAMEKALTGKSGALWAAGVPDSSVTTI